MAAAEGEAGAAHQRQRAVAPAVAEVAPPGVGHHIGERGEAGRFPRHRFEIGESPIGAGDRGDRRRQEGDGGVDAVEGDGRADAVERIGAAGAPVARRQHGEIVRQALAEVDPKRDLIGVDAVVQENVGQIGEARGLRQAQPQIVILRLGESGAIAAGASSASRRATTLGCFSTQPRFSSAAATASGSVGKWVRSPVSRSDASMKATCEPTTATFGSDSRNAT